jgi:hypothetical protein
MTLLILGIIQAIEPEAQTSIINLDCIVPVGSSQFPNLIELHTLFKGMHLIFSYKN